MIAGYRFSSKAQLIFELQLAGGFERWDRSAEWCGPPWPSYRDPLWRWSANRGVPRRPAIYAHRLGGAYGPESGQSTLARTLGGHVDGVEADVVLSADNEVFAVHDPALWLSTDLEGWAHERDATTLCKARLLDRSGRPSDDRPMRLSELLELLQLSCVCSSTSRLTPIASLPPAPLAAVARSPVSMERRRGWR